MVSVVIHTNIRPATAQERARGLTVGNQVETAEWLRSGFARHGIAAKVTADIDAEADIHVIQGPNYAYQRWLGQPNVLFLNRGFYGDQRFDLSIGWLNPDGSRDFRNQDKTEIKGEIPGVRPRKVYRGTCIVFGDYGRDMREELTLARKEHRRVYFRPHPAQQVDDSPVLVMRGELETLFDFADVAIGHSSTVLVKAELAGLNVTSTDPNHIVHGAADREAWLARLSWTMWNDFEIQTGDFWEHLH